MFSHLDCSQANHLSILLSLARDHNSAVIGFKMSYFNHLRSRIHHLPSYIAAAGLSVLFVSFVDNNIASTSWVNKNSMAPTLSPLYHETGKRDSVLVVKRDLRNLQLRWLRWQPLGLPLAWPRFYCPHARHTIRRGDVVVFWKPNDPEKLGVKRVVATEGDSVIRDLRRVGRENSHAHELGMAEVPPVLQVPLGHIWIEGDNWRKSLDSNDFGPISLSLVVGRAERILWPWFRFGDIPQAPEKDRSRTIVRSGNPPLDEDAIYHGLGG